MAVIDFSRPLVLATASPARRKLVADAGLEFEARLVSIDETPRHDEPVAAYVERLARAKAHAVSAAPPGAVIVAVDTAIGLDGRIIGKPDDEAHARRILADLSGRCHGVLSAIAVRDKGAVRVGTTRTDVEFLPLTEGMIDWYIGTGEWQGRAGAYAIQGKGACLVKRVDGCFTNVIGISMPSLFEMLCAVGG